MELTETRLSRRYFLRGATLSLALRRIEALQNGVATSYGVTALLDGSGMVRIPAGEFAMGSASGVADEAPVHRVRISHAFEMGKFEITQDQWKTVMTDPHAQPGAVRITPEHVAVGSAPSHFKGAPLPVESVSWDDIQVFLTRLNARDHSHLYRLPTEAEWEYACKAGSHGDDSAALAGKAWYKDNSDERTQPVGEKLPNAWGLFDMLGNVAEWVADWYGRDYYAQSPGTDPTGPATGSYRVYRGGCWFELAKYCRPAARKFDFPVNRHDGVGFRVARTARASDR